MALNTRARAPPLTVALLLSTRETVAVETRARRATCSRVIRIRSSLLTVLAGAQVPGEKRHDEVLEADGHGAGMCARVDLESVGDSVAVQNLVELARINP